MTLHLFSNYSALVINILPKSNIATNVAIKQQIAQTHTNALARNGFCCSLYIWTLFTGFWSVDIFMFPFSANLGLKRVKLVRKSKTRGDGSQPATQLINYSSWGENAQKPGFIELKHKNLGRNINVVNLGYNYIANIQCLSACVFLSYFRIRCQVVCDPPPPAYIFSFAQFESLIFVLVGSDVIKIPFPPLPIFFLRFWCSGYFLASCSMV